MINWIIKKMEEWAPVNWGEEWDNNGLILGDPKKDIKKVLVALDATLEVIDEAVEIGAEMILTHHPMLTFSVKRITPADYQGKRVLKMLNNNIAFYAAHTNLDQAPGGVNDKLFERLGLTKKEKLAGGGFEAGESMGLGLAGYLDKDITLEELAKHAKKCLNLQTIRYAGDSNTIIKKIGICGGNGTGILSTAVSSGCSVFLTGDWKLHLTQEALEMGMCIIDITHFASENVVVPAIVERLTQEAAKDNMNIKFIQSKSDGSLYKYC